jgi:hypothetical protein
MLRVVLLAKMGRSVLRPYKPMRLAAVHGSKDPPLLCGGGSLGLGGAGFIYDGGAD